MSNATGKVTSDSKIKQSTGNADATASDICLSFSIILGGLLHLSNYKELFPHAPHTRNCKHSHTVQQCTWLAKTGQTQQQGPLNSQKRFLQEMDLNGLKGHWILVLAASSSYKPAFSPFMQWAMQLAKSPQTQRLSSQQVTLMPQLRIYACHFL